MRLKAMEGPLGVYNGNNHAEILNSPKRLNTVQNSNVTGCDNFVGRQVPASTGDTTATATAATESVLSELAKSWQQQQQQQKQHCNNINAAADLATDTVQWSVDAQQLRTVSDNNRRNRLFNINQATLAVSLEPQRFGTASSVCSESSPDDSILDYEEAHQSCSSAEASPQDEEREFAASDSESPSEDGNPGPLAIRRRGIVNPNYPGFQHLAHTLDSDDDDDRCVADNDNNNNADDPAIDRIDSVNRLDSVENIQKVFYDKPVFGNNCNLPDLNDLSESEARNLNLFKGTERELEQAVEKLALIRDLTPTATRYNIEPNVEEPFNKTSPTMSVLAVAQRTFGHSLNLNEALKSSNTFMDAQNSYVDNDKIFAPDCFMTLVDGDLKQEDAFAQYEQKEVKLLREQFLQEEPFIPDKAEGIENCTFTHQEGNYCRGANLGNRMSSESEMNRANVLHQEEHYEGKLHAETELHREGKLDQELQLEEEMHQEGELHQQGLLHYEGKLQEEAKLQPESKLRQEGTFCQQGELHQEHKLYQELQPEAGMHQEGELHQQGQLHYEGKLQEETTLQPESKLGQEGIFYQQGELRQENKLYQELQPEEGMHQEGELHQQGLLHYEGKLQEETKLQPESKLRQEGIFYQQGELHQEHKLYKELHPDGEMNQEDTLLHKTNLPLASNWYRADKLQQENKLLQESKLLQEDQETTLHQELHHEAEMHQEGALHQETKLQLNQEGKLQQESDLHQESELHHKGESVNQEAQQDSMNSKLELLPENESKQEETEAKLNKLNQEAIERDNRLQEEAKLLQEAAYNIKLTDAFLSGIHDNVNVNESSYFPGESKKMDVDEEEATSKEEEKFCKEDKTKDEKEKDEDSAVPRKKERVEASRVKKRRDYGQQIGSLIAFPRRELGARSHHHHHHRGDNLGRRSLPMARDKKRNSPDNFGGFDVYNIETAMPKIDLEAIESHLRAAREEERRRRTDREEIRRRLAMGSEDDYYNNDRPGRKPSLQARLQNGMNLQICFMNETASDTESPSSDSECPMTNPKQPKGSLSPKVLKSEQTEKSNIPVRPATLSIGQPLLQPLSQSMTEADFFTRQARLQTEARMALAQAKEMARMQMEIERQRQKKSPITEMVRHSLEKVGIQFPEDRRRLSRQILTEMNVAQLQVIVNDLHTQIETLNESLVKFLMDRDDLHMEQDSMLVDIEDLTRYLGAKEQTIKETGVMPQNNNIPPPSPAPSSPLAALNSSVKPHLTRIASLVKKQ